MNQESAVKMQDSRKHRRPLDVFLMDVLGNKWCGSSGPPAAHRKMYVQDDGVRRVFSMQDDGGFVGIGYPNEWHVIMRTRAARLFAWWTVKVWVADWFGLRSAIYYRALHHHCDGSWRRLGDPKRVRALTWIDAPSERR